MPLNKGKMEQQKRTMINKLNIMLNQLGIPPSDYKIGKKETHEIESPPDTYILHR